jgi:hypothetical protein
MKSVPQDAVVVFIGRRRTGKSTLVRDLLFHHQDLPMGCVISGTEESNGFFKKIVPPMFIHGEYNPVILLNFVKRQKLVMNKIQQDLERGVKSNIDPRAFLILDDCMYDESWTHDKNIRYLFMNGRWLKVFFVITMQFPLGIPPALRTNVDYVFILREPYIANRRRIYENYAGMFPTFEAFCQVMDQTTENYDCMVINNNAKSNKLQDQVFWYHAESRPAFKLGSKEFWDLSNNIPDDDNSKDEYDPTKPKNKNHQKINVKKSKW